MSGELFKAIVGLVIVTPVSIVADVITLGGSLTDTHEPYTVIALRDVVANVQRSVK